MGILQIDQSKCKKDGICAGECPLSIIHLGKENGFPKIVAGAEEACLVCGHCVAVCPHGALSHERIPVQDCPEIQKELVINSEQAVQFLRSRRSIRFFKDQPVKKETIQKLIEVARYAPTGSNSQRIEWTVFTDKNEIKKLAGYTVDWMRNVTEKMPEQANRLPYIPLIIAAWDIGFDAVLRDAPALVIASAPEKSISGMVDLSLALSYLELFAQTSGVGTCWAGLLQDALCSWEPLKTAVGLPVNHVHHYPMMLGYPKVKYLRLPERNAPKINWK
jgi:nitroreductase/NAD-dependent dihydropyrimidine dehydrogenase PreA subunit